MSPGAEWNSYLQSRILGRIWSGGCIFDNNYSGFRHTFLIHKQITIHLFKLMLRSHKAEFVFPALLACGLRRC